MTKREITVLTDVALITCIVQRGLADNIILAAREAGVQGATVYFAQGMGIWEGLGILGDSVDLEKDIEQPILWSKPYCNSLFTELDSLIEKDNEN